MTGFFNVDIFLAVAFSSSDTESGPVFGFTIVYIVYLTFAQIPFNPNKSLPFKKLCPVSYSSRKCSNKDTS